MDFASNYRFTILSFDKQIRGPRLKDTVDVSALKPCTLELVEGKTKSNDPSDAVSTKRGLLHFPVIKYLIYFNTEDYDEESATAHVRRLLDIFACTTTFGPSASKESSSSSTAATPKGGDVAKDVRGAQDTKTSKKSSKSPRAKSKKENSPPPESLAADSEAKDGTPTSVDGEGEMNNTSPKLGSFYEFFSLSHLTPPLQCKISFF